MTPTDLIRLSRVHFPVTVLGPGQRLGIWVQGCTLACPGCMSRDTWDPAAGVRTSMDDVLGMWWTARKRGATGVTISGGEPSEQPDEVAGLIDRIRDDATGEGQDVDILLFTGLEEDELRATAPQVYSRVDAAVFGRFDITRPTDLLWRGSANQLLRPLTPLGTARYGPHLREQTRTPALQFAVEDGRIWTVGIPRIGDLPVLERRLRANGIESAGVSWRP
jgi:anaerobic ribonucleoside-triphosphate reductase activating protein